MDVFTRRDALFVQGGPEKILLETIDCFVANSNFCEPPCSGISTGNIKKGLLHFENITLRLRPNISVNLIIFVIKKASNI